MEDAAIVNLYWARDEGAIRETDAKYGRYCYAIAYRILAGREDSDESVNDTYLAAWRTMPPKRPDSLGAYLGRIVRNISLGRLRRRESAKRGGGEASLCLDELSECVASPDSVEERIEAAELAEALNRFLGTLGKTERDIFVCRYFFAAPHGEIAERFGWSEGRIRTRLCRTRAKLRDFLAGEGLI